MFHDKYNESVVFASPVSGEVADVVRGEKRKVMEVRILADKATHGHRLRCCRSEFPGREAIVAKLLQSGCWPFLRQRPFDVVADPAQDPKAIFISAFDTRPLAPDMDFVVRNHGQDLQAGLDALAKLTKGRVNLNVSDRDHIARVPRCEARAAQHGERSASCR